MPELKVTSRHLELDAYLYIQQSPPRQVLENTESTQRQYALRDRAIAFGWPRERIHVLDCDLGKSGSRSAGRDGFQKLVGDVALGKAGLVMGLEVSRLARNSADWHRLIELCSLAGTLILDKCEPGKNVEFKCDKSRPIGAEGHFGSTFLMRSLESLQPGNELGVMAPSSSFPVRCHEWLGFRQGLAFCFQIEGQILVSGIDAGVAQPIGNGAWVVAGTQQI